VIVSHPLAPGCAGARSPEFFRAHSEQAWHDARNVISMTSATMSLADSFGAKLLPFAVEICGRLAPDAVAFVEAVAEEGNKRLSLWSRDSRKCAAVVPGPRVRPDCG
jgi:hypothetical protein